MSWQPEMDELRRREELAEAHGRRREGQAPARRRPAHHPRAHRPAGRPGLASTRSASIAGKAEYDGKQRPGRSHAVQLRVRPRARSTAGPSWSAATTSPCAAARPTPPSRASTSQCERMANELRLPLIRIVEGSGGGGSVKTIETTGRANVPGVRGWEWVVQQHGHGAARGARPGLGRRPRRRAARRHALLGDGEGRSRRCSSPARRWSSGSARSSRQEGAGRLGDPARAPARSTRRSTREDEAFARARRFLSYLPSSVYDAAAARAA